MRAKSATNGAAFTSTFTVSNIIQLSKPGRCKITLFTYIHCYNPKCEKSNDFITIKIAEDGANYREIYKIGFERIRDRQWIYDEVDFATKIDQFQVINTSK